MFNTSYALNDAIKYINKTIYLLNMKVFVTYKENVKKIMEKHPNDVLIYNPKYVINEKQAEFAAILALKAFENSQNIAKKLPIEFLVRLSGEKQIKKALSFGIEGLDHYAGVVILTDMKIDDIQEIQFNADNDIISRKYGLEKENMEKMIYEKMALVDI